MTRYGWRDALPRLAHSYLMPAIKPLIPRDTRRIIDLGSGNGYVAGQLCEMGYEVVGVEPSEDGIALAIKAYPYIDFLRKSVYDDSGWEDLSGWADLVVAVEVIEHLYRPRVLVQRALQLLRPGGTLIVTTPYHGYTKNLAISVLNLWDNHFKVDWDGGHIKFFSKRTLAALISEAGFRECRVRCAGRIPLLWKSMVGSAKRE